MRRTYTFEWVIEGFTPHHRERERERERTHTTHIRVQIFLLRSFLHLSFSASQTVYAYKSRKRHECDTLSALPLQLTLKHPLFTLAKWIIYTSQLSRFQTKINLILTDRFFRSLFWQMENIKSGDKALILRSW